MQYYKKFLTRNLILYFCLISSGIFGQDFKIFYDLKYRPSSIKDSTVIEKSVLDITSKGESIFRSEQDRISDSLISTNGMGLGRQIRFENQFYVIKKINLQLVLKSVTSIYKDIFFIKIENKLDWKVLTEKSKIGSFSVQKAEVNYGGRKWIAWFTNEIPINDGPYVFYGLPGLIIKINDEKEDYVFNLVEIKKTNNELYYRKKGNFLTWEMYKKLCLNYYSDPLAQIKLNDDPYKIDDGNGRMISANLNNHSIKIKKMILNNNNPIEIDNRVEY